MSSCSRDGCLIAVSAVTLSPRAIALVACSSLNRICWSAGRALCGMSSRTRRACSGLPLFNAVWAACRRSRLASAPSWRAALFRISSTEASGVRGSSSRLFGAEAQPASTVVSVRARVDRRMERCMRGVLTSGIGAKGRRVGWRHCTQADVQSPRCTAHPGQLLYNASQIAFRKSHDHCCRYSFCGGYADR